MTPAAAHRLLAPLYARHPEAFVAFGSVRRAPGAPPDFECLYANPAAARALGHAEVALAGRRLLEELREAGGAERYAVCRQVVERGEAAHCEFPWQLPDGERWFGALVVPWEDGFTATLRDLSEHRRLQAERDLAAQRERAAQAEKLAMAAQLAAGVAHEVNNPLAFVLSNLAFVQEGLAELARGPGDCRFDELLASVGEAREGAERIRTIVRDLKAFAHPAPELLQALPLREAVELAAGMAANALRPRAQLLLDCPEELHVRGQRTRLGQVLLNLLLNAAQALPEGNAAAHRVRVTARRSAGGLACLEVQDTGRGIAPEHLTRIFDPFFTTRPAGAGSGLGLSVCHGIVQEMGGHIEVSSTVGEGTTVRLLLPLSPPRVPAEPAAA